MGIHIDNLEMTPLITILFTFLTVTSGNGDSNYSEMGNQVIHTPTGPIEIDYSSPLWVFGYGSLVWKPNFESTTQKLGYILGYERRFYQGNSHHRGTVDQPGRVATLLRNKPSATYGMAFELQGQEQISAALKHLNTREMVIGGYEVFFADFFHESGKLEKTEQVLVFSANEENSQYLGAVSEQQIACEVSRAFGLSGSNVEYVTKLADWQRENFPDVEDEHLYGIE